MIRHPLRNGFKLLGILALAGALALVVASCSRDRVAPTAPAGTSRVTRADRPLSISNPADVALVMRKQEEHTARLMAVPGVIGTGTASTWDGRPEILVLTQREGVAGLPAQLDGIAVETRFVGEVTAYATLQCGTSTGNDKECAAGTIGCVVLKGGTKYFLSNNHVFARQNAAKTGERIDAPGRYDAKPQCAQTAICASLTSFKTISFSSSNTIDAAIAKPDPSRPYTVAEACGYTPSSTVATAFVGQAVKKCGRTSGLTTGTVQAINVTIQVQYTGGVATFTSQIMTPGNFIRSGDSGSLMVEQSTNKPVGLCFAGGSGGSFSNPISSVLSYFGATVASQ
ncbi:MAG: hypothetical protein HZC42_10440 [Candidatus Eisenbacteria bacterium]|nr:hypothetical protein [Candidatus Eisenbacteria bacterium]